MGKAMRKEHYIKGTHKQCEITQREVRAQAWLEAPDGMVGVGYRGHEPWADLTV